MKLRMLADLQRRWWLGPTEQLTSFDPSSESIDVVDDDVESPSENQESEEPTVASQDQGEDNLPFPEMDNDDLHTEEGEQTILSDLKQFFAKCAALDPRGKRLSECSENEKAIVWNEILLEMEKEKVSIEPQVIPRSQIQKLRLSQQMFGTGQLIKLTYFQDFRSTFHVRCIVCYISLDLLDGKMDRYQCLLQY